MKKLLYILLAIKIFATLFMFFSLLGSNIGVAIVTLALGILEITVIIAVIRNIPAPTWVMLRHADSRCV